MDVDPLADTIPSRYAIESDDEDELNPIPFNSNAPPPPQVSIKLISDVPAEEPLVVAAGLAATAWVAGARLGEPVGRVEVQGLLVGLIFRPEWTKATVLISEVVHKLPIWAMHQYAQTLVDRTRPDRIALLDVYSVPDFIADTVEPATLDPIRYLSTHKLTVDPSIELFSPPNLIHSTSASFLTYPHVPLAMLLLLPYPHSLPPAASDISVSSLPTSDEEKMWPQPTMSLAHKSLGHLMGEKTWIDWAYAPLPAWYQDVLRNNKGKAHEAADGHMYI